MAYGDTMPEIRRRLARVVNDTGTLYVLAIQPYIATGDAGIPMHSATGGLSNTEQTAAAIERNPPSPGYLGAALHHYGSLPNR